ncbi:MAG TPA: hypothetical protein VHA75_12225 [Rugosimonospora sp.]|nr:hypothetical protein [Rugosimonospora sp.]
MVQVDDGGGPPPTDNWTPVGSDLIKVDIDGIGDYAKALSDEITKQFEVNVRQGIEPMMRIRAPMGGGGLKEGAFFQQMHVVELKAAGELLRDVSLGLSSLMSAALAIQAEYLTGDALSSANLDDVINAFYPGPGMKTMQQQMDDSGGDTPDDPAPNPLPQNIINQMPPSAQQMYNSDPVSGTTYDPSQDVQVGDGAGAYTIKGDQDGIGDAPVDPVLDR